MASFTEEATFFTSVISKKCNFKKNILVDKLNISFQKFSFLEFDVGEFDTLIHWKRTKIFEGKGIRQAYKFDI